jgi:hypothetical protein
MGHINLINVVSACVAVLFFLSVSVHPAMAAESQNNLVAEMDAFGTTSGTVADPMNYPGIRENGITKVTVDEVQPVAGTVALSDGVASQAAEPLREIERGVVTAHIADPLAGLNAAGTGPVAAAVASDESALSQVTANMSLEGYVLTGQSEHQYQLNTVSVDERFQNLNETEREKLAADGVETESAAGQTTFRYRVDVTYLVFTHQTTGSCQVVPVIRLLDAQGNPVGDPGQGRASTVHADDLTGEVPGCTLNSLDLRSWLIIVGVAGLVCIVVIAVIFLMPVALALFILFMVLLQLALLPLPFY